MRDGILSLLVRNGDGLAMRSGLLGDWTTASRAFDELSYDNRISVSARADRFGGMRVRAWYGGQVFTDIAPAEAAVFDEQELLALLACEDRTGPPKSQGVQHRAADTGMFVVAKAAVRASACAELDLSLGEVLFELVHSSMVRSRYSPLGGTSQSPAAGDERAVVQIVVPEQLCGDVHRQSGGDGFGGLSKKILGPMK